MARTTLKVTGMTCGHCVHSVKTALEEVEGVRAARVDLEAGRAVVDYDEGQTDARVLAGAVADVGYPAEESA